MLSPWSLSHFPILLCHTCIHSWKDSFRILLISVVTASLMSMSSKRVPFMTPFNLGKGKKIRLQCRVWCSKPKLKKVRQLKSNVKVMLTAFFDERGIVQCKFLPQGKTINQHVYKETLRCLLHSLHEKRQELWQDSSWLFHHDNKSTYNALSIWQFLAKNISARAT